MTPALTPSAAALPALPRTRNPLALWHLLSLDAPTVTVAWLILVAHAEHAVLPAALPACMFLAVWLIYASDRLLDTRHPHHAESAHHFHHTHRLSFTIAAALATAAVAFLLPALPLALLGPYLLLAALLFFWLLLIHFTRLPMPKLLAPGLFVAAAVFIPVLTVQTLPALILPFASLAALCTLNCLLIQFWQRHPQPTPTFFLHAFSILLVAAPVFLPSPIAYVVGLSAAALRVLSKHRTRLDPTTLRAAADFALLTPLLFLLF